MIRQLLATSTILLALAPTCQGQNLSFDMAKRMPYYSQENGYGIDTIAKREKKDKGFYFSVKVPDGNYRVTVTLGDKKKAGETTVRAENRRMMVERCVTRKGQYAEYSFVVNKREIDIPATTDSKGKAVAADKVRLKPGEIGSMTWDEKLTLEFNGSAPCVKQITISPDTTATTVFLCGNSTVVDQPVEPWASWGQMITRWYCPTPTLPREGKGLRSKVEGLRSLDSRLSSLDSRLSSLVSPLSSLVSPLSSLDSPLSSLDSRLSSLDSPLSSLDSRLSSLVSIANFGESGLTASSFMAQNRLKKVLSMMKPGDYVICEFGHNDEKEKGPGTGAWYHYTVALKKFVDMVREKQGNIIFCTPTQRRFFDADGKIKNTHGDFPAAMKAVAERENVPLIDLNAETKTLFETMGEEGSKRLLVHYPIGTFAWQDRAFADNTHFNPFGAYEVAKLVVMGLKRIKSPLADLLSADWQDFSPEHPDNPDTFYWPEAPLHDGKKPDGQ